MKYSNLKLLIYIVSGIFCLSPTFVLGQNTALSELNKNRLEAKNASEQISESLKQITAEKKILIDQLLELNKKHDEAARVQSQTKHNVLKPVTIHETEIIKYLQNKRMGRCKFLPGDYAGELILQKEKIKIRFAFLPKDSLFAPLISVLKNEFNEEVFQIEQPAYDPLAIQHKGEMQAIIRFKIRPQNNSPGEIIHAYFKGQRLNDQWFGKSSLALTDLTCVLGID